MTKKRDSGPFRGSLGRNALWETATVRNCAARPFIHESGKLQGVNRPKFRWLRARLSRFSCGWPQKGSFGPFLGPKGVQGRHAKTAAENGSNPVGLLKCHVRREKGPTRGGARFGPTAPDWPAWVGLMVTTHFGLVSGLSWVARGPQKSPFWPKMSHLNNKFSRPNFEWDIFSLEI